MWCSAGTCQQVQGLQFLIPLSAMYTVRYHVDISYSSHDHFYCNRGAKYSVHVSACMHACKCMCVCGWGETNMAPHPCGVQVCDIHKQRRSLIWILSVLFIKFASTSCDQAHFIVASYILFFCLPYVRCDVLFL